MSTKKKSILFKHNGNKYSMKSIKGYPKVSLDYVIHVVGSVKRIKIDKPWGVPRLHLLVKPKWLSDKVTSKSLGCIIERNRLDHLFNKTAVNLVNNGIIHQGCNIEFQGLRVEKYCWNRQIPLEDNFAIHDFSIGTNLIDESSSKPLKFILR